MDRYAKLMKVKTFDLEAGELISIMHEKDAKELGVLPLDRVQITNPKNRKKVVTVVDHTTTMVEENEIGLFEDAQKELLVFRGDAVEVKQSPQPESVSLIKKKLSGETLNENETKQIVIDISSNKLSQIETSAFMTAAYIRGYTLDETAAMAKALVQDGKRLQLKKGPVLDKHSIGGVNGRTTMVIVPIVAALGCIIPKTSSRSITSAAGTADAMEVLADVALPINKIKKITEKTGGVIAWGGAVDLAPADDKIIKIEHPLSLDPEGQVIASVLAKKASVGAKFVAIDLPTGEGAKVSTRKKAEALSKKFVEIGKKLGMKVKCTITNASEPCGNYFGAALEAKNVLEILEGKYFDKVAEKSCRIAGILLEMSGKAKKGRGEKLAIGTLKSGKALKKMQEIIKAQGARILKSSDIPKAPFSAKVHAKKSGLISKIDVRAMIKAARIAGAPSDKLAGIQLSVEKGEKTESASIIFEIYAENEQKLALAKKFALAEEPVKIK